MNKTIAKLGRRLRLGVIGGGPGSFIGPVHRAAARMDDNFEIVASVLSSNPERSRSEGRAIGIAADRATPRRTRCSRRRRRAPTAWRSSRS
jgi:predicted dehydrogenase